MASQYSRVLSDAIGVSDQLVNFIVITNFSPDIAYESYTYGLGVPINRWQEVEFDVLTFNTTLTKLTIELINIAGISETVYDLQNGFSSGFSVGSGRQSTVFGYRFTLAPKYGWPQKQFTIKISSQPYNPQLIDVADYSDLDRRIIANGISNFVVANGVPCVGGPV